MKTILKTSLAALLFAGVSTAALAQDHDHADRGERAGGAHRDGGSADHWQSPQGGHARFGAPSPSAAPSSPAPAAQPAAPAVPSNPAPRFNGGAPGDGGGRHWDRGGPGVQNGVQNLPPARTFDHARPNEVVPPTAGAPGRGWDGRHDGNPAGVGIDARNGRDGRDGRWDGRNDRRDDRRDGRWDGNRDGRDSHWAGRDNRDHRDREHWQQGRYPPVYWSQNRFRIGAYRQPYGFYARAWAFGDILPRGWYGPDYYLNDFLDYGLPYPPPGYEWVRVGGDAVLIDEYTGRIVQVVRGIFW